MDPQCQWDGALVRAHRPPQGARPGQNTGTVEVRPRDPENYERERQKDEQRITQLLPKARKE